MPDDVKRGAGGGLLFLVAMFVFFGPPEYIPIWTFVIGVYIAFAGYGLFMMLVGMAGAIPGMIFGGFAGYYVVNALMADPGLIVTGLSVLLMAGAFGELGAKSAVFMHKLWVFLTGFGIAFVLTVGLIAGFSVFGFSGFVPVVEASLWVMGVGGVMGVLGGLFALAFERNVLILLTALLGGVMTGLLVMPAGTVLGVVTGVVVWLSGMLWQKGVPLSRVVSSVRSLRGPRGLDLSLGEGSGRRVIPPPEELEQDREQRTDPSDDDVDYIQ